MEGIFEGISALMVAFYGVCKEHEVDHYQALKDAVQFIKDRDVANPELKALIDDVVEMLQQIEAELEEE